MSPRTSMTVRLDDARYQAMKHVRRRLGKTSQQVLMEALDLWLRHAADEQRAAATEIEQVVEQLGTTCQEH